MNKRMSLKMKVILGDGLMGLVWLGLVSVQVLKLANMQKNIALAIIIVGLVVSIGSMFVKYDKEDEMSKENMVKAEANTYRGIRFFLLLIILFGFNNTNFSISLNRIIPFAFGIMLLLKAILFFYYEKYEE